MTEPHPLTKDDFLQIVKNTPLVSIDLIIKDPDGHVLVGVRVNEPARGFYFVPGGRIQKNERIREAFARILTTETGCQASFDDAVLLGVYEHIYDTNFHREPGFGTHYVVLGYQLQLDRRPVLTPDAQHTTFAWMSEAEIVSSPRVHENTRAYFQGRSPGR
jgi:colanic acid biosynthesis protein WcaH